MPFGNLPPANILASEAYPPTNWPAPTSPFPRAHTYSFAGTQPRLPADQPIPALWAHDLLAHIPSHMGICLPQLSRLIAITQGKVSQPMGRVQPYPPVHPL